MLRKHIKCNKGSSAAVQYELNEEFIKEVMRLLLPKVYRNLKEK